MRSIVLCLAAAILVVGPASADDGPAVPPRGSPTEVAADAARDAFRSNDRDGLKALAERYKPDPWLVADLLCHRGEHDVAEAFAKAAPRPDVRLLPGYVAAWRTRTPDRAGRQLLDAMDAALRSKAPGKVVEGTASSEAMTGTVVTLQLLDARSAALEQLGRSEESEAVLTRAAKGALELGWLRRAAYSWNLAGESAERRFDWDSARAHCTECLAVCESRGERLGAAETRLKIGRIHWKRGDYAKALEEFDQVLAQREALEGPPGTIGEKGRAVVARAHAGLGNVHMSRGDYEEALASYGRAKERMESLGDAHGVARMRNNLGRAHQARGEYNEAKTQYDEALRRWRALKDVDGEATALGNLGSWHHQLGDFARALGSYQSALSMMEAQGLRAGEAELLGSIGNLHQSIGDHVTALDFLQRARGRMREIGNQAGEAETLANIGNVQWSRGDYGLALETYRAALKALSSLGNKAGEAATLGNIGVAEDSLGQHEAALATYTEALERKSALRDRAGVAMTLANIGEVHQHLAVDAAEPGARDTHLKAAEKFLSDGRRYAESCHAGPELVAALGMLARLYLETGKPARALDRAREALGELETLLGGLGDEHGATARERHAVVLAVGALAAMREDDAPEAFRFLETGRAGALLDMLGKGEALRLRAESLSEEVQLADRQAQVAERAARRAYDVAVERGDAEAQEAASLAIDAATAAVRAVADRIQRELKQRANLLTTRAEPMEDVQASLRPDQALVIYGFFHDGKGLDEAVALVLRRDGARLLSLGQASGVEETCVRLTGGDAGPGLARSPGPSRGALLAPESDPREDWAHAVGRLRDLLVKPLRLEADVREVLVSPDGPLSYLPFGVLFEQTVAMTPSGTTHLALLRRGGGKGQGILALGDPDYAGTSKGAQAFYYRGSTLATLSATRREVEAIGTKTLLGKEASEAGLLRALPGSPRWRAVHFACHGLLNVEQPMLSSLALSRGAEDEADGFLSALEILRMEIPADLAVLSACDTSRGRIVRGEGIMGFTRAFMFAGAPRVICSLWKVDDQATAALMIRFYELWNPKDGRQGLGAAAALEQARAFVRGQEKWADPHYWAAWTLWGLPD